MTHNEINIAYIFEDANGRHVYDVTIIDDDLTEWIAGVSEVLSPQDIEQHIRRMFFQEAVHFHMSTIMDPQGDDPPIRPIFTKEEYNKLDSRRYHKTDKDKEYHQDTCVICTEKFKSNNKIPTLKCKHDFHWNCLKKWSTKTSKTCPSCRTEIS